MELMLSRFVWEREDQAIYAYASDLGYAPGIIPGVRLFQDACDFGIRIRSNKTNKVYAFVLDENRSDSGAWEYVPVKENGVCCDTIDKVVIFND